MLRRKLLLVHGSLVGLLLIAAIVAISLLNDLLGDMTRLSAGTLANATRAVDVSGALTAVESALTATRRGEAADRARLAEAGARLRRAGAEWREVQPRVDSRLTPPITQLATAIDRMHGSSSEEAEAAAFEAARRLRQTLVTLSLSEQAEANRLEAAFTRRFRSVILGLGLAFLLVINTSIIVLLRAATMVVRPVEELVEASRELGRGRFDHRVRSRRRDEFGELASAYNHLARRLERNETRKIETMHQVARTLNHELNNVISIIDLQLELADRQTGDEATRSERMRHIHDALERMSETVGALNRVRQIVLTDYVPGMKMLDLERSVEERDATPPTGATAR
ncbi:MAG: HAMP domain-containing protein [Phycisphaerales bacterium]|nr:HAMP domain-containing protein [Phycisphaerae bacterium]NNF42607.1 HAMP domain-containing protein [Phycisphaerales bacterium]NNM26180.1 HAMP domain-containing protein [Phycisphaerales bacterium]